MKREGQRSVWSVKEITAAIYRRFEDVTSVWVEAEIQDVNRRRGQVRFRLVGEHSISGSMNEIVFDRLPHRPNDGTLVQAYGRVQFFARTSTVSMRVERLDLVGEGLLRARVAELVAKLEQEGLLATDRKRPLPMLPRRVGVVTSGSGAARHDIERTIARRDPRAGIMLVDSPVQGDAAPAAIVRAVRHLDAVEDVDVIIIARGGGSLEDLMAFNSEPVCRAIASCGTPVVSAVGHESDTTVSDVVADARASTPTGAAEMVVPDVASLERRLDASSGSLARALRAAHERGRERLEARTRGLAAALHGLGGRARDRVDALGGRLDAGVKRRALEAPAQIEDRRISLERAVTAPMSRAANAVERSEAVLAVLSPERTVQRGYAIVRDGRDGRVLSAARSIDAGQPLRLQLADGDVAATAGFER